MALKSPLMSLEMHEQGKLSKEVLVFDGKSLFEQALRIVTENEGFREALVKKYIKNPQGESRENQGRVEFTSSGVDYTVKLDRSAESDRINITRDGNEMDEGFRIELYYETEVQGACSLFGGEKRAQLRDAQLIYQEMRWRGPDASQMWVDNMDTVGKIKSFIESIK